MILCTVCGGMSRSADGERHSYRIWAFAVTLICVRQPQVAYEISELDLGGGGRGALRFSGGYRRRLVQSLLKR